MLINRSSVRKCVNNMLAPTFKKNGFRKIKNRLGGYRLNGQLVEVICLQVGRSPGSLYLHYFVNCLADPFKDIFDVVSYGVRMQGNECGEESWFAETEKGLEIILSRILVEVESQALPFFEKFNSFESFVEFVTSKDKYHSLPFSLSLFRAMSGDFDEAKKLCERSIENLKKDEEYDFSEDAHKLNCLTLILEAENNLDVERLVEKWSSANAKKYGIVA